MNRESLHVFRSLVGGGRGKRKSSWRPEMEILEERVVPNAATINWNQVDQLIAGFGASSAYNLNSMTTAQANLFFSQTSGIGLSILRSQISDLSTSGTSDEVTTMQQAQADGALVFSTPWSPPAVWKSNGSVDNGGYLLPADYQNYANMLTNYVLNMKADGINIAAISIQNEPNLSESYDSCTWTSQQIHDFIAVLGPTFASNGITAKIMLPEESGWTFELLNATLADPTTAQYVGIVAGHDYGGAIGPVNTAGAPAGTQLWETETSDFSAFDPSMTSGLTYATQIYDYMTVAQANAWNYWWLISSNNDNEGLLGEGGATTKRLYTVGNYSKFIRPGFNRISETDDGDGLEISTYKNISTGQFVIVVVNPNSSSTAESFNLNGFSTSSVTPWETSASLNLAQLGAVSVNGTSFNYTFDADSVTTFVGTANSTVAAPTAPTSVAATPGNAQVNLTWSAVTNATSYNIYRSTSSGGEGGTPYATGVTSTNYTDTSVTNGTVYYYKVSAVDSGGESPLSSEVSATPTAPAPTAPTAVTAAAGTAQVVLSWTASSGATSYSIYRSTTSGGEGSTAYKTGVTSTSFSDTGLTVGTTYYYQVTAINSTGASSKSSEVSATPTGPIPSAPTGVSATAGNAQVVLTWTASSGATSYNIYRSTTSGGEGSTPYKTGVTSATFTDTGLTNGTTYYYQITAVSSGGESGKSSEVSAAPKAAAGFPAAPTGVSATAGNGQVVLTWTASSGATSYNIYRSTTSGGEGSTPYKSGVTATSFTDAGLTNGTTYYYQVTAVNSTGEGAKSSEVLATSGLVLAISSAGPATGQFVADTDYSGGTTSSVTSAINTSKVGSNVPASVFDTQRYGNFTYTIPNLTAGASYSAVLLFAETYFTSSGSRTFNVTINGTQVLTNFDIYAMAGGANIAIAEQFTATASSSGTITIQFISVVNNAALNGVEILNAAAAAVPSTPTGLSATPGNGQVALSWTASSGAASYNIYRSTTSGGEGSTPYQTGVTGTTFTDTAATNGTTYYYVVTAVNAGGESAKSSEVSAKPAVPIASAPTGLTATAGNGQVALSWTASSGATSYNIYRSTKSGGEGSTPYQTGVTGTTFTDIGVTNGTAYFYVVTAVNTGGESAKSNEVSAKPAAAVAASPTGLSATAGNAQVVLAWAASTGATSYNIYRSTTSGGEGSTPYQTGVTGTTFTDASVTNGTTYYYQVTAVNTAGESAKSSEVLATGGLVLAIASSGPATGQFVADTDFNGGSTSSVTSVVNTSKVGSNVPASIFDTQRYGNFTYTIPNLSAGSSYTVVLLFAETYFGAAGSRTFNVLINGKQVLTKFDIYATAGGANIANAQQFTATANAGGTITIQFVSVVNNAALNGIEILNAAPAAPPPAPTGLSAADGPIVLSWGASAGATSYNIYRSTTSGGEGSTPYQTGVTTNSFTDASAANGTTYYYQVTAVNAAGESAKSSEVSATTPPSAPTGLSATAGNAQVVLSWPSSTGATSYNIYRSTTSGGEGSTPYKTGVTATTFTDTGLTNGTTYYYEVTAVDGGGEGSPSSEVSAKPAAAVSIPTAPTGLGTKAGNDQIVLTWTASSGATTYNIYRSTTSGGEGSTPYKTGVTSATFTDTSLTNGTTYYYQVTAVNSAGESAKSSESSTTSGLVTAIAAGGSAMGPFVADTDYSGGTTYGNSNVVSASKVGSNVPAALFDTQRYGNFTYTIPNLTAGASYSVVLLFAETYWTAAGQRTFNVAINGTQVLSKFDVYATAGGANIAIAEQFTATANSSGNIVIQFTSVVNNAEVNGIEILNS
jgi:fibronectin type 3 domain-containing protein/O-glycosyl hydrolase